jgi:uncharacterized protein YndB with AHSA1/START domain
MVTVSEPSDLEILVEATFEAPIDLVFDVLTNPEHLVHNLAPFDETVTVCEMDLRVGGDYHFVFETKDGVPYSFRGTILELAAPFRVVQTWIYEGWEGVVGTETIELSADGELTHMHHLLKFDNEADRAHMKKTDGIEAGWAKTAAYIANL